MSQAANYSAIEVMRDGRSVELRALRPDDQDQLLAAIHRTSPPRAIISSLPEGRKHWTDGIVSGFTLASSSPPKNEFL